MCSFTHPVCVPRTRGWEDVAHVAARCVPNGDAFFAGGAVVRTRVAPGVIAYVAADAGRAIVVAARDVPAAGVAVSGVPVRGEVIRAGTTHYVARVREDPSLLPPHGAHRW